ncbi:MAG: SDR family oxidoreductase [Alphaproteobacteria bacterium]|nr:SDR family oxidoreductase [Alphaproteobacteria bacterium]
MTADSLDTTFDRLTRRAALTGAAALAAPSGAWSQSSPGTVLITGASRGIGLEMAKQYAARGYKVIATAREPGRSEALRALAAARGNVRLEGLDVVNIEQIDALAAELKGTAIDILINNAGISGGSKNQVFGQIKYEVFDPVMHTNVRGPLKMAEAFFDHVAASAQKKLVNISSTEGSIGTLIQRPDVRNYFYRASKAALNMVMVNVAKAVKDKGVIVGIVSPGLVRTDFAEGLNLPIMITAEQSAAACIGIIGNLTMEQSGTFLRHSGGGVPW